MSKDSDEIVVATTGSIFVAPVTAALPATESAALPSSYVELGYSTDDGVSFSTDQDVEEITAWQSRDAVRRLLTSRTFTAATELLQWNADTLRAAFGGGQVSTVSPGHFRFDFLDDAAALEERILVVDFIDHFKYRLVMPRTTLNDGTETNLNRTSAGTLPLSLKALKPDGDAIKTAYLLTNDPAFNQGS